MKSFVLVLIAIFLIVQFIGFTALSVVELNNIDRLAMVLGGLIGMLIISPVVWLITQPLHTEEEVITSSCPKGGEHRWGNPWINSEGPEGGELGRTGRTCLKCGTDKFI